MRVRALVAFIVAACGLFGWVGTSAAQIITTVAGQAPAEGPAHLIGIYSPEVVATDSAGNVYFGGGTDNRVRKMDRATGVVRVVGNVGWPSGIAVAASGDVYVATQSAIDRIDAHTGLITPVAGGGSSLGDGGPATDAGIQGYGLAVDAAGNIYFADAWHHRIRRIDGATQIITTIAGNGAPGFSGDGGLATAAVVSFPFQIAVDGTGNLFFTDADNNRVRRIDAATGIITTVAGTGTCGSTGDGGLAISAAICGGDGIAATAAGDVLVVGDGRVRRIEKATGIITRVAGTGSTAFSGDGGLATLAAFSSPGQVAVDGDGNFFVADKGNDRIRRVDGTSGVITTVVGGLLIEGSLASTAALGDSSGVAVKADGTIFISQWGTGRVLRVDPVTKVITTYAGGGSSGDGAPAADALLLHPAGLALDAAQNLYIADTRAGTVRRVDAETGLISTIAGGGWGLGEGGPATAASVSPTALVFDTAGNLFIAESDNNRVRRVSLGGIISTVAGAADGSSGFSGDGGLATSATLSGPASVTLDAAGNLYIADLYNERVRRVAAGTGIITTVAGNGTSNQGEDVPATTVGIGGVSAVAVDSDGNLLLGGNNSRVYRVDLNTGLITTIAGSSWGFSGDGGPARDAEMAGIDGFAVRGTELYVIDSLNHCLRRIGPSGIGPLSWSAPGGGGTQVVTVGIGEGTAWTAVSGAGWLTVSAGGGTGSGIVRLSAGRNTGALRTATVTVGGQTVSVTQFADLTGLSVDTSWLPFAGVQAGSTLINQTGPQIVHLTQTGMGSTPWAAVSSEPWLEVTPASGTGAGDLSVNVVYVDGLPPSGTVSGTVTVVSDGLAVATIAVRLTLQPAGAVSVDTPALAFTAVKSGSTLTSVTGVQVVHVLQAGANNRDWWIYSSDPWLRVTPGSGSGASDLSVSVAYADGLPETGTVSGTLTLGSGNDAVTTIAVQLTVAAPGVLSVNRQALTFGAVKSGSAFTSQTAPQTLRVLMSGAGSAAWTIASSSPWLQVTPGSGSGPGELSVSVVYASGLPNTGTVNGTLTLTSGATTIATIAVRLTLKAPSQAAVPFGTIDTPANNATGVVGAVPFTGWALDDVEVTSVALCRAAVTGETAPLDARCGNTKKIYVGDAVFIDGARPDVEAAYATYPLNTRAGWGFMVLTNMLPNIPAHSGSGGVGTFTFTFYVKDRDGHTKTLGARTITCANGTSALPFGTLDTPGQGAIVSGAAYSNFGWALTPKPKTIPVDGSTLQVYVDGAPQGHPAYGYPRADIQALFPGLNNTDTGVGVFTLDTTTLSNGVHTISWSVCDDANACTGIGSRFFGVLNGGASDASTPTARRKTAPGASTTAATIALARQATPNVDLSSVAADTWAVAGRRGWDPSTPVMPFDVTPEGVTRLRGEELDRLELQLGVGDGETLTGYLRANGELRPLPVGASIDAASGTFTWAPGVGFIGRYDLVFVRLVHGQPVGRREVRVTLAPKGSGRVGLQVTLDALPTDIASGRGLTLRGWAADLDAARGTGVTAVHAWAYPAKGAPVFLGAAQYGVARADVASVQGAQFRASGFALAMPQLARGSYDLAVFARRATTGAFGPAHVTHLTVR